jgi:hypothetical protein
VQCSACWLWHNYPERCLAAWTNRPSAQQPAAPPIPNKGPRTQLKKMLAEIGAFTAGGCGCESKALAMDRAGAEWCRENRQVVIGWLKESLDKITWTQKISLAYQTICQGMPVSLTDPVGSFVDEAIRRSEAPVMPGGF